MSDKSPTPQNSKDMRDTPQQDSAAAADDKKKDDKPEGLFAGIKHRVSDAGHSMRMFALRLTPRFIVNNSSNILGFSHVLTEMMMFKSSNKDGKLVKNPDNPVNWVWEPFKTVFEDTFKRSSSGTMKISDLFKGNPFKNFYEYVTDVDAATARGRNLPENVGKDFKDIHLGNSWVARSTMIGLTIWSLSALIPEKKEKPEEIERMTIKSKVHPVGYVLERIKQGLWFPEWNQHKREMLGIGNIMLGITSAIGAWRGRGALNGKPIYAFNPAYLGTAIASMASGFPLLFASDEQRGYGWFGTIMMFRIPFLFKSIHTKYNPPMKNGIAVEPEPGRHWYLASSLSFQAENFSQALIGGAEKRKDGTIIDHSAIRKEASAIAKEEKTERRDKRGENRDEVPSNQVSQVSGREAALPMADKQQSAPAVTT